MVETTVKGGFLMTALITFDEQQGVFHLHNRKISYLLALEEGGILSHLYFGSAIDSYHGQLRYPRVDRGFSGNLPGHTDRTYSLDTLPQEYSASGDSDYRLPAAIIEHADGSRAARWIFKDYQIVDGKPELAGLPQAFVEDKTEAQTLIINLVDEVSHLELALSYTIYREQAIITRSSKLTNLGSQAVTIKKLASLQIDFVAKDFESICLPGAHANERHLTRAKVTAGVKSFESRRGSSSHHMNPFLALVEPKTDEFSGEAYGFALVYSGNHKFELEQDQIDQTRLLIGINDYNFSWDLQPQASFTTPEVLMTYSEAGLNRMSQAFHQIIQERVVRSKFKHQARPILVNNWEATYFDFDEEKLKPIVADAKKLGIEMFVLDDGWFGHRDDDTSSLGDWSVYKKKFPQGIKHFSDYVHEQGLKFGIWVEPEMISLDSDLYRQHPDYLMQVPGRTPSPSRSQFVLDMSRPEVQANVYQQLSQVLDQGIDYIKWDMNRNISDVYSVGLPASRQGEVYHRYILGVYALLEKLTTNYPDVLFEGCSGGGGRFDAGWAYYMPQSWASDNTDAIARLTIQYGTSLAYPISTMTAHVSAVPNHQTGRQTPLKTRGDVAMSGVFGYELDLTKLSQAEQAAVKKQVASYKQIRSLIQYGKFYRLKGPYEGNQTAWMFVSPDQREAMLFTFQEQAFAQGALTKTHLAGLKPDLLYREEATGQVYSGAELMKLGLYDPVVHQDYTSKSYHFKALD